MKNSKLALALIAGTISIALCAPASFAVGSRGNSPVKTVKTDKMKAGAIENKMNPSHQGAAAIHHKKTSGRGSR